MKKRLRKKLLKEVLKAGRAQEIEFLTTLAWVKGMLKLWQAKEFAVVVEYWNGSVWAAVSNSEVGSAQVFGEGHFFPFVENKPLFLDPRK